MSRTATFFAEHKISKLNEDEVYTLLARLLKLQLKYTTVQPFIDQVHGELTYRRNAKAASQSNFIAMIALYIALIGAGAAGIQAWIAWLEFSKGNTFNSLCELVAK